MLRRERCTHLERTRIGAARHSMCEHHGTFCSLSYNDTGFLLIVLNCSALLRMLTVPDLRPKAHLVVDVESAGKPSS